MRFPPIRLYPLFTLAAFALAAACAGETETGAAADAAEEAAMLAQDEAALRDMTTRFDAAGDARDVDAIMTLYGDDSIRMNPNMPALAGKTAIRETFASSWGEADYDFDNTPVEVRISGDLAAVRGTYVGKVTPKGGGPTVEDSGKWLVVAQRQADGTWTSLWEIWNSDLPVAPAQ